MPLTRYTFLCVSGSDVLFIIDHLAYQPFVKTHIIADY